MDVDLRFIGKVEIEHVRDVFYINAPTGDIGGHQHKDVAFLERGKSLRTSGLALVPVNGIGWNTDLAELLR